MRRKIILGLIALLMLIASSYIVAAPIWYGSGDDTGLARDREEKTLNSCIKIQHMLEANTTL